MTRDIVDVIKEDIVDMIDNTTKVTSVIFDTFPDIRFKLCDLKWLKEGQLLTDDEGNPYIAQTINYQTKEVSSFRISEDVMPKKGTVMSLIKPKYYHGTSIVVNNEIPKSVKSDLRQAVPMIWVKETIPGYRYPDDSSQDFDAEPIIYFLDGINEKLLNPEQRKLGVKPMLALKEAFLKAIEDGYGIERRTRTPERTISRFGRENEKGMFTYILDMNLGGVEIRPTLTISKSVRCTC